MSNYFNRLPNLEYPSLLKTRRTNSDTIRVKNLFRRVKIREDLFYYMDRQLNEVYEDTKHLFQNPDALLLIRKTHEPVWLKDFPDRKIILEMDADFETYQLFEKVKAKQ